MTSSEQISDLAAHDGSVGVRAKAEFDAWHERLLARRREIDAMPLSQEKLEALREVQDEYKEMQDLLTHIRDRRAVPRRMARG